MGARVLLTVVIITAAVRSSPAQTTTADGVAALARGDYQLAVEILKPIAVRRLIRSSASRHAVLL